MRLIPTTMAAALCFTACVCTRPAERTSAEGGETVSAGPEAGAVTMTPMAGEAGYRLEGPQGFSGTLTYADGIWTLNGAFSFPTAGYTAHEPDVAVLKRLPEEAHITLGYEAPPADAVVAQVVSEATVSWTAPLRRNATFMIRVARVAR